jgi:hypothetical protein
MTTYPVYLRSDIAWTRKSIDADTPEQAVELARRVAEENPDSLDLDFYELCDCPINEIEINDEHGNELAVWYDDDMRLRLAARDLLEALRFCDMTLADLHASKRKGYIQQAIRLTRAALAKAKGGAP